MGNEKRIPHALAGILRVSRIIKIYIVLHVSIIRIEMAKVQLK
jgi:hypothetical protein